MQEHGTQGELERPLRRRHREDVGGSRRTGVQPSALRSYERVGPLKAPRRVSGQRRYEPEVLEAGFAIAEIREPLDGFDEATPASERRQALAQEKLTEVRRRIEHARRMEELLHALLDCRCTRLQDCARYCGPAPGS